jgi:hypothetical protein
MVQCLQEKFELLLFLLAFEDHKKKNCFVNKGDEDHEI